MSLVSKRQKNSIFLNSGYAKNMVFMKRNIKKLKMKRSFLWVLLS